jgi:hypothetical protein
MFHGNLFAELAGERRVSDNLALRAEAGYLGFWRHIVQAPLDPLRVGTSLGSARSQTARFVPVALGFRVYSPSDPSCARGYLQFAPAVFWLRSNRLGDSFTALRPGIVVGAGVRTRLGDTADIEWGIRYLYSGRIGERPLGWDYREPNPRNYAGLNNLAFVFGVGGTP